MVWLWVLLEAGTGKWLGQALGSILDSTISDRTSVVTSQQYEQCASITICDASESLRNAVMPTDCIGSCAEDSSAASVAA